MRTRLSVAVVGIILAALLAACRPPPPPPPPPGPMSLGWSHSGVTGPVAADTTESPNLVWAMGGGTLWGLDASTGAVAAQHPVTRDPSEHFPTPAIVPNWVLVESGAHIAAFSTPAVPVASQTSWLSDLLDGIVQARPLVVGNIVVAATENNSLYGLNLSGAQAGHIAWGPVNIGTPESQNHIRSFSNLTNCGDIFPLGITSNPVLGSNGNVYAVGEVQTGTGPNVNPPVHQLLGVRPSDGVVTRTPVTIDPPGMNTPAAQQRAGLIAGNGHIYVGFGGLVGDCGSYHGWIVSASESDGSIAGSLEITASSNAGAVWATAGAAVDGSGNIYAATGNGQGSPNPGTDYSDAVVVVPPTLSGAQTVPADYFQPSEWRADNNADLDLGSAAPVLLPNGTQLFVIGKQHNAFLLNTSSLGGSDHNTPAARLNNACSGMAFGQNAVIGTSAYIACSSGMQQVHLG